MEPSVVLVKYSRNSEGRSLSWYSTIFLLCPHTYNKKDIQNNNILQEVLENRINLEPVDYDSSTHFFDEDFWYAR